MVEINLVKIYEGKTAIELLENWSGWLRGSVSKSSTYCSSMYMSPEEKILAGASCKAAKWNEQQGARVEAILAVMMQNPTQQIFVRLLQKHFYYRANPMAVCRKERLSLHDYDWHIARAIHALEKVFQENSLTPTKMLRYSVINNPIPLRREQNPSRVLLCA
ncbi:MAG: hypothetical protein NT086_19765 [Proteobacteria bacterium]|nr:hypothetical protein [Pseudomonadota bacterium]